MPTYEYECRDCGEGLEVVQGFEDDNLEECPSCGGSLRRVFSAAGIIFKGSGWHSTDYGRSGSPAAADQNRSSGSSDDNGQAEGSDNSASSSDSSSDESSSASEKSA